MGRENRRELSDLKGNEPMIHFDYVFQDSPRDQIPGNADFYEDVANMQGIGVFDAMLRYGDEFDGGSE
ncbi:MAG: hypothetical protein WDZ77_02815 [Candidatus Pacearchaeota archaeon]